MRAGEPSQGLVGLVAERRSVEPVGQRGAEWNGWNRARCNRGPCGQCPHRVDEKVDGGRVRPNSGNSPLVEHVVAVTRASLLRDRVRHVGSAVLGWRVGRTFGKSEKCLVDSESRHFRAFIAPA